MVLVRPLSLALGRLSLLALFAFALASCGGNDGGSPLTSPTVSVKPTSIEPLAAGSPGTLSFIASNSGAPLAGRTFRLYAPDKGPKVTFDGGQRAGSIQDVTTGADGSASATITTGPDSGPVLIGVEDRTTGQTYTVPVSISAGTPALSGQTARNEIAKLFPETKRARLHGPALLPEDAQLWDRTTNGNPPLAAAPAPGTKWVFWYDQQVGAEFTHPVKWIVLDANDAAAGFAARAQVTDHEWFPSVLSAGAVRYPLIPGNWTQLGEDTQPAVSRGIGPNDKSCAILVSGPNLESTLYNMQLMRQRLIDSSKVKADDISFYPQPVGRGTIQAEIDHMKALGCKKIYFYYTGHGMKNAMALEDADGNDAPYFYDVLARDLVGIPEVCVFIQACHSATAIQPFQNLGLTGEIITSASEDESSLTVWDEEFNRKVSAYTRAVVAALSNPEADRPPPDGFISFREAAAWVAQNSTDPDVTGPKPVGAGIGETEATTMPLPAVKIIKPGETATATILRPTELIAAAYCQLTLTIAAGSTATFTDGSTTKTVVMGNDAPSVDVAFKGVQNGTTTYSVTARAGTGQAFSGQAGIEIGGSYAFSKPALDLLVGQPLTNDLLRKGAFVGSGEISRLTIASTDNDIVAISTDFVVMSNDLKTLTFTGLSPGTVLVAAIDEERDLRTEFTVRVHQELTLEYDLRSAGGSVLFHKGDKIRGDRIRNYHIVGPHIPICDHWHYHAATSQGIFIDDPGPFPDPEPGGCGYGHALAPPAP